MTEKNHLFDEKKRKMIVVLIHFLGFLEQSFLMLSNVSRHTRHLLHFRLYI